RPPEQRAVVLDACSYDYPEDEGTGRILAVITTVLERNDAGITLRVAASAIGPRLDPVPGWQGVRGGNRITAEEIESSVSKPRIRVETDAGGHGTPVLGSVRAGRRGRIAERRRLPDGSIDVTATTAAEYPIELVAETPPLADGRQHTRLVVDGKPRLE